MSLVSHSYASILALGMASQLALSGCATTGGPKTAVQEAMGKCTFAVGGGAILGALVGEIVDGKAGTGALIGAGAGAGVCGFMLHRASEEDKARIEALELAALNASEVGTNSETFTATNGQDQITVFTRTETLAETDYPDFANAKSVPVVPRQTISAEANVVKTAEVKTGAGEVEWTNCRLLTTNIAVGPQMTQGSQRVTCRDSLGDWHNFG